MQNKVVTLFKKLNNPRIVLIFFIFVATLLLILSLFYTLRSYNDYAYGKFDLGNMNQMVYNSSRGHFMRITDEFGGDASRFSMSHVDPSLLIFVPIYWFYADAAVLVVATCLVFYVSSLLLYFIARKEGLSPVNSSLFAILIYLLPISGYIIVWTAFHPLLLAIPSILGIYYWFQVTDKKKLTPNGLIVLILLFVMFLLSKEELGLVFAFLSPYLIKKFPDFRKLLMVFGVIGLFWSFTAFVFIIPRYSDVRAQHTLEFLDYIDKSVGKSKLEALSGENFFLVRYNHLGTSYKEISLNILKNPYSAIQPLFSEESASTHLSLFGPTLFSIFIFPLLILGILPEILIHGLAGESGIYSIENHRLAILIPILLFGVLDSVKLLSKYYKHLGAIFLALVLTVALVFSLQTKNPLIYPLLLKFQSIVNAKEDKVEWKYVLNSDCADFILSDIPPSAKVSVPQPLGAHTSSREYNALFPTGLNKSDVIVVDVLERKVTDFLDLDISSTYKSMEVFLNSTNVSLKKACNRLILVEKNNVGESNYTAEYYPESTSDFIEPLALVTYKNKPYLEVGSFDSSQRGDYVTFNYTYTFSSEGSRHEKFAYTVLKSSDTEWEFVHMPTFYHNILKDSGPTDIIKESFEIEIPDFVKRDSEYEVYMGIGSPAYTKLNTKIGTITIK